MTNMNQSNVNVTSLVHEDHVVGHINQCGSLLHAKVVAMVSKPIRKYMSRPYMSHVAGHHTMTALLLDHPK